MKVDEEVIEENKDELLDKQMVTTGTTEVKWCSSGEETRLK